MAVLLWACCARAGSSVVVQGRLNHSLVQQAYLEADWGRLGQELERFLVKPGRKADQLDSVCAFKFLAAIRASRPETRAIGEEYFRRLLVLNPAFQASELRDLFVSADVIAAFRSAEKDLRLGQGASARKPTPMATAASETSGSGGQNRGGTGSRKAWVWLGTGGAALAAVAGAFFILTDHSGPEVVTTTIPVEL
jgi:hypothetical protein